jgi:hypothetical protein
LSGLQLGVGAVGAWELVAFFSYHCRAVDAIVGLVPTGSLQLAIWLVSFIASRDSVVLVSCHQRWPIGSFGVLRTIGWGVMHGCSLNRANHSVKIRSEPSVKI